MKWIYSCPKCTAILNPDANIILLGRHEGCDLLLAFHPEPGNYEISLPHSMTINEGELWEFFCPVCHETMSLAGEKALAGLDMTDGQGVWNKVVFSRLAGELATFVISREPEIKVRKHGDDHTRYEHYAWNRFVE